MPRQRIMLVALRIGELSIVSALTALYPAGTIILAAIVLRERVGRDAVGRARARARRGRACSRSPDRTSPQPRANSSTHDTMSATTPRPMQTRQPSRPTARTNGDRWVRRIRPGQPRRCEDVGHVLAHER